jgi:alcohol dehydrogenase class IV
LSLITLDRVPRINQAAGAIETLGATLAALTGPGAAVLLAVDPGLRATGVAEIAAASLQAAGLGAYLFEDIKSDPTMAQVDAAVALARSVKAKAVVSIGGGSAMDVGKSIAAIAGAAAPASHYGLCANPFPAGRLISICVPTTSGTGSETTRTAVLGAADGSKVWLWGDEMKPDLVLLDPALTVGLPAHLTAATGIDALVHAVEAATNANANALNDLYCHEAIRLVVKHLPRAVETPTDLVARGGLQWAASLAGIAIDNCGTAIAHNIGHALASLRPIHHGRAVALGLRATLPWNIDGDASPFDGVAIAMGVTGGSKAVPGAYDALLRRVGLKLSLSGEGHDEITVAQLAAQMARPENEAMRRSNRRVVGDADLRLFAETLLAGA